MCGLITHTAGVSNHGRQLTAENSPSQEAAQKPASPAIKQSKSLSQQTYESCAEGVCWERDGDEGAFWEKIQKAFDVRIYLITCQRFHYLRMKILV